MKRFILTSVLSFLLLASTAFGAMTYSVQGKPKAYWWRGGSKDIAWRWAKEAEDRLEGTEGFEFILLTPGSAPSTAAAGQLYYDTSTSNLKYYTTGWQTIAASTAVTLDEAYDSGYGITVDGTAMTLTVTDNANNAALIIAQDDVTNNTNGLEVVMGATNTGIGVYINGVSSGTDISGDNFSIANTGKLICVGIDTTGTIIMANNEVIDNSTNDTIVFTTGDEDLKLDFTTGSNYLTLSSTSAMDTIDFGAIDAFIGVAAITGDAGANFAIGTTNTGTYNLTVSQVGTGDNQVIVQSAGTAANAVELISSVAGITLTSADDVTMAITDDLIIVAADDISINSNSASGVINLGTNNDGVAINIGTDDTAADTIAIGSVKDTITIPGVSVTVGDNSAASATIIQCGTGDITLDSGDDIFLTADTGTGDVISLICTKGTSTSSIVVTSTVGGIDLDSALSTHITSSEATGDAIYLHASDAAGGVDITSGTGDIALVSTDEITLTVATAATDNIIITNTAGTSTSEDTAAINLIATAGAVIIQSDANLDDCIQIRADGGTTSEIIIHNDRGQAADAVQILVDDGGITLTADGADTGDILIDAEDDIQLTTTGKLTITNTEAMTVSGAATISGTTTVVGFVQIDQVVTDQAAYTVLAANSGKIHTFAALTQNTTIKLPAEADGLNYEFWYVGGAADAEDHIITSEDNGNYFIGSVVHLDTSDDSILAVFSDGDSNSKLTINNVDGGTIIKVTCDGNYWYLTGIVVSNTVPTIGDQ